MNEPFPPEVKFMSSCIVYNLQSCLCIYIYYALWPQSFYVARVVFQSLKYSWKTAPYTSATIATLSTESMLSFSSFTSSWPLSPMAGSQKFQLDPSLPTGKSIVTMSSDNVSYMFHSTWVKSSNTAMVSANLYAAVVYITRRCKDMFSAHKCKCPRRFRGHAGSLRKMLSGWRA